MLLLSACSHDTSLPPFTASGYADNQGAVRIWRKDSSDEVHMLTAFSPWHNGNTSTAEYRWQGCFLIPLALLLSRSFGLDGALLAAPIADALAFLLCLLLARWEFRSWRRKGWLCKGERKYRAS